MQRPYLRHRGGVEASDTVPAHNLVLRPIISPVGYTISYDLDGGTVATANPTSYNIESGDITLNNPTKEGYEFTGWTGSNGYSPSKSVTIQSGKTGDLSFTANWELATYSITYDLDGGTVATANPTSYSYFTDTFTLNNPTREGYTFLGWTGSNGSTAQTTVKVEQGSAGDLTYMANWDAIKYYVIIDYNGGTDDSGNALETEVIEITEESSGQTIRKRPYKDGYTFAGFSCSVKNTYGSPTSVNTDSSISNWYLLDSCKNQPDRTITYTAQYGISVYLYSSMDTSSVNTYGKLPVKYKNVMGTETTYNLGAYNNSIVVMPESTVTFESPFGSETIWNVSYDPSGDEIKNNTSGTGNPWKSGASNVCFSVAEKTDQVMEHNTDSFPYRLDLLWGGNSKFVSIEIVHGIFTLK